MQKFYFEIKSDTGLINKDYVETINHFTNIGKSVPTTIFQNCTSQLVFQCTPLFRQTLLTTLDWTQWT